MSERPWVVDACPTCDKHRDGCDFCCGTTTGDGSREELMTDRLIEPLNRRTK